MHVLGPQAGPRACTGPGRSGSSCAATGIAGGPRAPVERLMRSQGLRGARRGKPDRHHPTRTAAASRPPDLVKRDFAADRPEPSCGSSTSRTCRRGRGWRSPRSSPTSSPAGSSGWRTARPDADRAAAGRAGDGAVGPRPRRPGRSPESIHHSDAGSQYTVDPLRRTGSPRPARSPRSALSATATTTPWPRPSIGLYKTECVRRDGPCRSVDDLELATLSWVALVQREPAALMPLGYIPPTEYENEYYRQTTPPAPAPAAGRTRPLLNPGRFSSCTNARANPTNRSPRLGDSRRANATTDPTDAPTSCGATASREQRNASVARACAADAAPFTRSSSATRSTRSRSDNEPTSTARQPPPERRHRPTAPASVTLAGAHGPPAPPTRNVATASSGALTASGAPP